MTPLQQGLNSGHVVYYNGDRSVSFCSETDDVHHEIEGDDLC